MVKYAIVRPVPNSYDHCVRTNVEKINVALAKKQHAEYCKTLERLGLKLIWVKGDDKLPDSCFIEDAGGIFCERIGNVGISQGRRCLNMFLYIILKSCL
ncbi:MAG: hypothetical protein QHH17_03660 [Candidatus Bathyarchaeota archaeon]|nr:hypothetical protein [Candidatus Bathyarchaeota archaeon]